MENRSVSFGITGVGLVVALVALAFRGTPSPTPQQAVTPVPGPTLREGEVTYGSVDSAIARFDRGRRLIGDFLGGSWVALTASRDTTLRARLPLRVTIVTIPDPNNSHMDWSFDANLEALRRAMGTAGYVPQSFWLPPRGDSLRIATGGLVVRYPAHDVQPGVFLFRSTNVDAPSLHVLYLVPEIPTAGVQMQAFRAAVAERAAILTEGAGIFVADARERAELSVLGPNFSGSALSLRALVDASLVPRGSADGGTVTPRTARLVTGSATAFDNLRLLSDSSCVVVPRRDAAPNDRVRVARIRFAATVNPDEAMNDVLREVIDSLRVAPYQVAVLTEAGTGYGAARPSGAPLDRAAIEVRRAPVCSDREDAAGVERSLPGTAKATAPAPVRQAATGAGSPAGPAAGAGLGTAASPTADSASRTTARSSYLTVPFPLNIASLRSEFERSPAVLEASPNLPRLGDAPRTRLSLDATTRSRESPALASNLSVASLDVVLGSLIRTLNEHDVRVVVIKATDVRDKLMLARELRRGVRDVVVIVYEGHVLLRRPEYADALRGAFVLSSYPLALENQFWTTAHRRPAGDSTFVHLQDLLAFPTDAALGVYNAVLTLLGRPELRAEYALHNAFAADSTHMLPPVWLSVVGRDGFYPLRAHVPSPQWWPYLASAVAPALPRDAAAERPHEHSYTHDDVSLSVIIVMPALLLTALLAMFLVGREGMVRRGLTLPDSLARPASAQESLYLALFILSLSATYLPFSVAVDARRIVASVDPFSAGPSGAMWIVLALVTLVVVTGLVLLANGVRGLLFEGVVPPPATPPSPSAVPAPRPAAAPVPATEPQQARPGATGDDVPGAGGAGATLGQRLDAFLAPMRAPGRITGSVAAVASTDDLEQYLHETTRLESVPMARLGIAVITGASALFIVASFAYTWHLLAFSFTGGIEATFSLYRALHLTSGVSPLLPLALLGGGFAIWTWWQLQQARKFSRPDHFESGVRHLAHVPQAPAIWRRTYRSMVDARRGLSWISPGLGVIWIVLAVAFTAWFVWRRRLPTLEVIADSVPGDVRWFDIALWLGLLSLLVSSSWAIYRLVHTWHGLERFLDILAGTPLACAFARLPLDVVRLTNVGFLGFRRDSRNDDRYAAESWARARDDSAAGGADPATDPTPATLATILAGVPRGERCTESVRAALEALRAGWELLRSRPDPLKDQPIEGAGAVPSQLRALRALEEYVACEVVLYLEQYLLNLRRLCFFLFASLLILVMVGAQYPYQPHSVVSLAAVLLLACTVASVFLVMVRMSRNVALSRISRTEPGKVTWDTTFILNMVTFGIVPLLALASSEFPQVRAFLFSWAEPLVRAVVRS